jgi:hypothetical protein
MQIDNKILDNYYSTPLPEDGTTAGARKPQEKAVEDMPKTEATNGSKALQKEVLGLASLSQPQLSYRETAQKQLKNGYLDITI